MGASITEGRLAEGDALTVTSEMNDDGVVFGDGIEDDRMAFNWGLKATVSIAAESLRLAV